MSYRHFAQLNHTWCRTLLIATLPLACAVGVQPTFEDNGDDTSTSGGSAGQGSGGTLPFAGSTSTAGTTAKAGNSASGGSGGSFASPFGGTSSTAGQSGGGAGGAAGAAGSAGSGGAGGSANGGAAGAGTGTCACPKKLTWTDNTNVSFGPGDCLLVDTKIYLYTGTKAQTWANKDCNPTMQLTWCSDIGADYKFMLCQ